KDLGSPAMRWGGYSGAFAAAACLGRRQLHRESSLDLAIARVTRDVLELERVLDEVVELAFARRVLEVLVATGSQPGVHRRVRVVRTRLEQDRSMPVRTPRMTQQRHERPTVEHARWAGARDLED